MRSKKIILSIICFMFSLEVLAWGKTGHRIVGEIAQKNLSLTAQKGIERLLGNEDLARVATWSDEIRSDKKYSYTSPWHYVSIPSGKNYFDQKRAADGDIIFALFQFEETLRDKKSTTEQKKDALRFMVHMIGDLHQPLHVGLAEDRGGNNVRLKWFKTETNLHALWDESIVDFEQFSYTEYSEQLNHFTKEERASFGQGSFLDWAQESQEIRSIVYDIGPSDSVGYEYHHKVKPVFELRLRKAGLRLANVLNKIFENKELDKRYLELRQKVKANI